MRKKIDSDRAAVVGRRKGNHPRRRETMTDIAAGFHALEAVYYMRKHGQAPPDEVR